MASLWSYQESTDELKQKLFYTSLELESLRTEATEEMRKNKESVKQLFHLLKVAYQERDEARDQLQKILTKIMPPSSTQRDQFLVPPHLPVPESPLLKPTKANSSITESNSLSDAYNHSSSPVDSLFDPVSSPEFSNFNIENHGNMSFVTSQQPFVQDYNNGTVLSNLIPSPKFDQASMVIDNMVKGKVLPQKGKLLQAVLEAGPLLQTLLVAGPLPRWRNPPPLQSFHIPPVSMNGTEQIVTQNTAAMRSVMNSQSYVEMSCGNSQMLSTSVLNFDNGNSGSYMGNGRMISAVASANNCIPAGKRQRFQ